MNLARIRRKALQDRIKKLHRKARILREKKTIHNLLKRKLVPIKRERDNFIKVVLYMRNHPAEILFMKLPKDKLASIINDFRKNGFWHNMLGVVQFVAPDSIAGMHVVPDDDIPFPNPPPNPFLNSEAGG